MEHGAITIVQKEVQRSAAYFEGTESSQSLELNPEQKKKPVRRLLERLGRNTLPSLQGITGSGKTEVYLQIIQGALG